MKYTNPHAALKTGQKRQTKPNQTPNNEGGYVFKLDSWKRLERFLILGSDAPTYYQDAKQLTVENGKAILECVALDAPRTARTIREISYGGRGFNNDAPLFALAMMIRSGGAGRRAAYSEFNNIVRTGSHMLALMNALKFLKNGWPRSLRSAVAGWYNDQDADRMAYQTIKYQSRFKWTQRDVLRMAHVKPTDAQHAALYKYIVKGESTEDAPNLVGVYERIKKATSLNEVIRLIADHNLTWEFVPGQWLGYPEVWAALLPNLPLGAMIRNLGQMTASGLLAPLSDGTNTVLKKLSNLDALKKARIHPLGVLNAMRVYGSGGGIFSNKKWQTVPQITDMLEMAFYSSFEYVEPTGKRILWAQDVSGSMSTNTAGKLALSCCEAGTAMAMAFLRSEKTVKLTAFNEGIRELHIKRDMKLSDALRYTKNINYGGTDCAMPMIWAKDNRVAVDTFVVCTDNETHSGHTHVYQALEAYRQKTGIPAKLVVMGMTATPFTIANPDDGGMLDIVGMDTQVPALISSFARHDLGVALATLPQLPAPEEEVEA